MSDPVLEALAARARGAKPPPPSGDPVMDALSQRAAGKPVGEAKSRPSSWQTKGLSPVLNDLGETAAHVITGAAGGLGGGLSYLGTLAATGGDTEAAQAVQEDVADTLTYQPRDPNAQRMAGQVGNVMGWLGPKEGEIAGDVTMDATGSPALSAAVNTGINAIPMALGLRRARSIKPGEAPSAATTAAEAAAAAPDPLTGFGADSASAAAASRINAATNISPELLTDLRAQVQRGPLNSEAVDRLIDADALPVRMRLMEGQASRDPETWSREFNAKGKDRDIAERFNVQNQQLIDNLDEFRREAAPQAVAHDPVQSGQNIVDAYKTADNAAREKITAAYTAAREANGGDLPMDAQSFTKAADATLKKNMKARYLPSEIAADLAEIRETGSMNFETFENLRTNLAAEARKAERSGDGNAAAAISQVRDALESTEPLGRAKEVKPLFDTARTLAKARFDKMKADPAYKAAVNDDVGVGESSPLADKFVQKYIVGAPRAHVERMLETLGSDDLAMETVRAAPFNYLKQKAGIDPYRNEGNFSQHGYNRALAELTPKLDLLAGEQLAEQAQRLGRVAHTVKGEPSGSFPNRSNTFIAATAEAAKGLAERSANTLVGGNIVPVGSWAREKLDARAVRKESKERLRPAAGALAKPKKSEK